jgi:integrase
MRSVRARSVEQNGDLLELYLARVSTGSRRSIRQALAVVARGIAGPDATAASMEWHRLRPEEWAGAATALRDRYSGTTMRKFASALRGILRVAQEVGLTTREAVDAIIPRGRRAAARAPDSAVTKTELRRLFESCRSDETAAGCRDAVVLALLYGAGLRRSELVRISVTDYHVASRKLILPGLPRRVIAASDGVHRAIRSWLKLRGSDHGPLVCPINSGGNISIRRISDQALYYIVQRRVELARVRLIRPNDLKRAFKPHREGATRHEARRSHQRMLHVPFQGCCTQIADSKKD